MLRPSGNAPAQYRQFPDATIDRCPVADRFGCGATIGATGAVGAAVAAVRCGAGCGFGAGASGTPNVGRSATACDTADAGGCGIAAVPPLPGRRRTGGSVVRAPSGAIEIIVVEYAR